MIGLCLICVDENGNYKLAVYLSFWNKMETIFFVLVNVGIQMFQLSILSTILIRLNIKLVVVLAISGSGLNLSHLSVSELYSPQVVSTKPLIIPSNKSCTVAM